VNRVRSLAIVAWAAVLLAGEASANDIGQAETLAPATLSTADGQMLSTDGLARQAPLSVFVFLSDSCPCFAAHRAALRELASRFGRAGVQFFLVDAERHPKGFQQESPDPGTGWPILVDARGAFARAVNAGFATFSLIVAPSGSILYRGAIDSARKDVTPATRPFLRAAIEAALAGKVPVPASTKALGCVLRF
jgi:hypothetical protein